jgi:hypothetical protein
MKTFERVRGIAVLVGLLVAGVSYGLATMHQLAVCGAWVCAQGTLLAVRHILITVALPFLVGYAVAILVMASLAARHFKKKK